MHPDSAPFSFLGKCPAAGDFVRHRAGGPGLTALDAWLSEALHAVRLRQPGRFETAFDAMPPYDLHFAAPAGTFRGRLFASRDRVGRRFPFVFGFEAPTGEGTGAMAGCAERLDRLTPHVRAAVEGHVDAGMLPAILEAAVDGARDARALDAYLHAHTLAETAERLWPGEAPFRQALLFRNLHEILAPLDGDVPGYFTLVLRFPLAAEEPHRTALAAFWVETVRRLVEAERPAWTAFWTAAPGGGAAGRPHLSLFLRPPAPRAFALLLDAEADDDDLCVLDRMGEAAARAADAGPPPPLARALAAGDRSLAAFLQALS